MGNVLEVKNIRCGYGDLEVIKGLSFSVGRGGFLGIIGPNGSGKTTLFRAITRTLGIWEGSVSFNGRDINEFSFYELAREVAVMPQILDMTFPYSVEEFVLMGRFPHVGRFGRLKEYDVELKESVLSLCDISHFRKRRVNELSGGERQMAVLAQALVQEPKLLLLDEPTSHLDIGHQIEILDLVKCLNRKNGLTVIAVLHDLNLAGEYCENVMLMNDGAVYKSGLPEDVLTYQNIEDVYKTVVVVEKNPVSKKPYVFPVSRENLKIYGEHQGNGGKS